VFCTEKADPGPVGPRRSTSSGPDTCAATPLALRPHGARVWRGAHPLDHFRACCGDRSPARPAPLCQPARAAARAASRKSLTCAAARGSLCAESGVPRRRAAAASPVAPPACPAPLPPARAARSACESPLSCRAARVCSACSAPRAACRAGGLRPSLPASLPPPSPPLHPLRWPERPAVLL
jgi:hypothetical protein